MPSAPVMESDSLQIIPAPWDTTTNQLVPTTSFSIFFMFPPLLSIHKHECTLTHVSSTKSLEVSSNTYVKDHSFQLQNENIKINCEIFKYKSILTAQSLLKRYNMVKLKNKQCNLKHILVFSCSKKNAMIIF